MINLGNSFKELGNALQSVGDTLFEIITDIPETLKDEKTISGKISEEKLGKNFGGFRFTYIPTDDYSQQILISVILSLISDRAKDVIQMIINRQRAGLNNTEYSKAALSIEEYEGLKRWDSSKIKSNKNGKMPKKIRYNWAKKNILNPNAQGRVDLWFTGEMQEGWKTLVLDVNNSMGRGEIYIEDETNVVFNENVERYGYLPFAISIDDVFENLGLTQEDLDTQCANILVEKMGFTD